MRKGVPEAECPSEALGDEAANLDEIPLDPRHARPFRGFPCGVQQSGRDVEPRDVEAQRREEERVLPRAAAEIDKAPVRGTTEGLAEQRLLTPDPFRPGDETPVSEAGVGIVGLIQGPTSSACTFPRAS